MTGRRKRRKRRERKAKRIRNESSSKAHLAKARLLLFQDGFALDPFCDVLSFIDEEYL